MSSALSVGCEKGGSTTPPDPTTAGVQEAPRVAVPEALGDDVGGRLFDRFYGESDLGFEPGKSGGPNGDGTLHDGGGNAMPSEGHDYRLKNLFGWDLRGADGIYGPEYQAKKTVLPVNLLTDSRSVEALVAWLTNGDDVVPAYGEVMSAEQILSIAEFVDGVRTGALPGPTHVFELSKEAPKNYTLKSGADAERGKQIYADACAGCHGEDARNIAVDGDNSVGLFARTKAYEGWLKVLNGHPGSSMHREITFTSGDEGGQQILDLFAALCDRTLFPSLDGVDDVPDGDLRCGSYLK